MHHRRSGTPARTSVSVNSRNTNYYVCSLIVSTSLQPSESAKRFNLDIADFATLEASGCSCQSVAQRLVLHGLFPTAPSQPRIAISIDLLNFYHTLFEESCDAVHAMAQALRKFYQRRGYMLNNSRTGDEAKDPFRRSLGYAIQWHDSLRVLVDREVDRAIAGSLSEAHDAAPSIINKSPVAIDDTPPVKKPKLARNRKCSRELQNRCPACFGGDTFGQSFHE